MSILDGVDADVETALGDIRREPSPPINWVLVGFQSPDTTQVGQKCTESLEVFKGLPTILEGGLYQIFVYVCSF
jgi:hypothetical protein